MPRFFFQVGDGRTVFCDERGQQLASREEAEARAAVIAAELAQDGTAYHGFFVCVVDDAGHEVAKVPIAPAAGRSF
jgi:hypothetical protein